MKTDFSQNIAVTKCVEFSLSVIPYCEKLERLKKWVVSRQLIRSATSIGANLMEAQSAESRADFIHKVKVADKEACETWYWLTLCQQADSYPDCLHLHQQLTELIKLLNSILKTAKNKGFSNN